MRQPLPPVVQLPAEPDLADDPCIPPELADPVPTPELLETIRNVVQAHREFAQRDGGDLDFVALEHGIVRVRLTGACTHCHLAGQTLGTVRRALMQATGLPLRVAPALD